MTSSTKLLLRMETRHHIWGGPRNTRISQWMTGKSSIYWWIQVGDLWHWQKGVYKDTNRRENDTTAFQTHSETWCWTPTQKWLHPDQGEAPLVSSETRSTLRFDLCGKDSYCSRIIQSESKHAPKLWLFKSQVALSSSLWHHKKLCERLSNHAGITWVIGFCRNLWRPCQLECTLSLKQKQEIPNATTFWNSWVKIQKQVFWLLVSDFWTSGCCLVKIFSVLVVLL